MYDFKKFIIPILPVALSVSIVAVYAQNTSFNATITKNEFNNDKSIIHSQMESKKQLNNFYYLNIEHDKNIQTDLLSNEDLNESDSLLHSTPNFNKPDKKEVNNLNPHNKINISISGNSKHVSFFDSSLVVQKANSFISSGDYGAAEDVLDSAILKTVNSPWALAEYADLYTFIKKYEKAISTYQKALKFAPERIEILYSYALCLYKSGRLSLAESQLHKVVSINPQFMLAYYNLGNIYFKKADYRNALKSFAQSVKLNPLNSDAFYNTALTLEVMEHYKLAERYYIKCLEINPHDNQAIIAIRRLNRA